MIFAADIKSAVSEQECARLAKLAKGKAVLEIGAEYGRSTIALASSAEIVWSVDWHLGDRASGLKDSLPEFMKNIIRYDVRRQVVALVGRWDDIGHRLGDEAFDLVFHDGCHDAPDVHRDLFLVQRVLRRHGLIVVHDTDQPETGEAVQSWAEKRGFIAERTVGSLTELRQA